MPSVNSTHTSGPVYKLGLFRYGETQHSVFMLIFEKGPRGITSIKRLHFQCLSLITAHHDHTNNVTDSHGDMSIKHPNNTTVNIMIRDYAAVLRFCNTVYILFMLLKSYHC